MDGEAGDTEVEGEGEAPEVEGKAEVEADPPEPDGGSKEDAPAPEPTAADRLFADDSPAWLRVHLAKLEQDGAADLPDVTDDELADLPPAIQRMLARIVHASRSGKAALAEQQAAMAATKAETEARHIAAVKAEAAVPEWMRHPKFKEFLAGLKAPEDAPVPDPWSAEGIERRIDERVNEQLARFFKTFDDVAEDRGKVAAKAEADSAWQARANEIEAFYAATPDLKNPGIGDRVLAMCKKYGIDPETRHYNMRPEDAYRIVMNELAVDGKDEEKKAHLERARSRIQPGSGHGRPAPAFPKEWATWDGERKAKWIAANRETVQQVVAEGKRTGRLNS